MRHDGAIAGWPGGAPAGETSVSDMDAVWIVGPGRLGGHPLRYSIRSVVENLSMVDRIVTVGYRWRWLVSDLHVDIPQDAHKHVNTYRNLRAAIEDDRIGDEFVFMNDDFFVLEPLGRLPVLHAGRVVDRIAGHERAGNAAMRKRRQSTLNILRALGVDDPLDYELHVPLVVDKAAAVAAFDLADKVRPPAELPTGKRTIYGNLAKIGGEEAADVKVRGAADPFPGGPLVSTSASSWVGR